MKLLHLFLGGLSFSIAQAVPPDIDTPTLETRTTESVALGSRCGFRGTYACVDGLSDIAVCSPANVWILSAQCEPGCCLGHYRDFLPHCNCNAVGNTNEIGAPVKDKRDENLQPTPPTNPGNIICPVVGAHGCIAPVSRYIGVCNSRNVFEVIADCGADGCCTFNNENGVPYCDCRNPQNPGAIGEQVEPIVNFEVTPTGLEKRDRGPISLINQDDWYCEVIGEYRCATRFEPSSLIVVCNPQHRWQETANCGRNCCKYDFVNKQPYCDCRESSSAPTVEAGVKPDVNLEILPRDLEKRNEELGPHVNLDNRYCETIGEHWCAIVTNVSSHIVVCNSLHQWQVEADCGQINCCQYNLTNRQPYCDCRRSLSARTVENQSELDVESEIVPAGPKKLNEHPGPSTFTPDSFCHVSGAYHCGTLGKQEKTNFKSITDSTYIVVCNSLNQWQVVGDCGGPNCCKYNFVNGQPYCDCVTPPSTQNIDQINSETPRKRNELFPGWYCPDINERTCVSFSDHSFGIMICNSQHQWQLTADCGDWSCCKVNEENGLPYCDCRNTPTTPTIERHIAPEVEFGIKTDALKKRIEQDIPFRPGEYCTDINERACSWFGKYFSSRIVICNPQHRWEEQAHCGDTFCCKVNPDNKQPYCDCRESESHEKRSEIPAHGREAAQHCDVVGGYVCDLSRSAIGICNAQHVFQLVAECGGSNCCKYDDNNGQPYCDCRESRNVCTIEGEPKPEGLRKRNEPAVAAPQRHCETINARYCINGTISSQMLICNPQNELVVEADCGGPNCCRFNAVNNQPYCDCRPEQSSTKENRGTKSEDPFSPKLARNELKGDPVQFDCIPPGFSDEDSCLNVCGPRYPPCFAYCTCKTDKWPLSTRIPTATPMPTTLLTSQRGN